MEQAKCDQCLRRDQCGAHNLAVLTLPWVLDAIQQGGSMWDRAQAVKRALRGCGPSPGFVEDWVHCGAMAPAEADQLVQTIIDAGEVSLAMLCQTCRHYMGPQHERVA